MLIKIYCKTEVLPASLLLLSICSFLLLVIYKLKNIQLYLKMLKSCALFFVCVIPQGTGLSGSTLLGLTLLFLIFLGHSYSMHENVKSKEYFWL